MKQLPIPEKITKFYKSLMFIGIVGCIGMNYKLELFFLTLPVYVYASYIIIAGIINGLFYDTKRNV